MEIVNEKDFIDRLLRLAEQSGIPFTVEQARKCHVHISLMLEWNRRLNLTRITRIEEILVKHILDSLAPGHWLPRGKATLDVGTGPGFPGIPLKILHPDAPMLLLEANRKKVSFLKVVASRLGMEGLDAVQGRWEEMHRAGYPPSPSRRFGLAIMRAVRLEAGQLEYFSRHVLEAGGVFAWWAGPQTGPDRDPANESSACAAGMTFDGAYHYELPEASGSRMLLTWRKKE